MRQSTHAEQSHAQPTHRGGPERPHRTGADLVTWLIAGWADADWVKNLRASSWATLTKGTRVERIRAVETTPNQGAAALRAFVQERGGGRYAFGLDPHAPLESFEREAEAHPIFWIAEATADDEGTA